MSYEDDIWEEYQDDECMSCGRTSYSCDCDASPPVVFDEESYSATEGIKSWSYVYNHNRVVAQGDVQYDTSTKKYDVTVDSVSEDYDTDVIERYVYKAIREVNE